MARCFLLVIMLLLVVIYFLYSTNHQPNIQYKICICMSYTDNIKEYARLSEQINKRYAMRHGYSFYVGNEDVAPYKKAPQWSKILVLKKMLEDPNMMDVDYFFWIDADAIFHRQHIPIEHFIKKNPLADIIICDDIQNSNRMNSINTGTMIIRNSNWNRNFFRQLWNYNGPLNWDPFHEQTVMEHFMNTDKDITPHITVLPGTAFNSYFEQLLTPKDLDKMVENNFVIHLMATEPSYRRDFLSVWLKKYQNETK